jgi:hypothetical protein
MQKEKWITTQLTWAVVLKSDLNTIGEIKNFLKGLPDCRVIYQTTSGGRLTIVPEGGNSK